MNPMVSNSDFLPSQRSQTEIQSQSQTEFPPELQKESPPEFQPESQPQAPQGLLYRLWSEPALAYRWARRVIWLGLGLIIGLSLFSAPLAMASDHSPNLAAPNLTPKTPDLAHTPLITVEVTLGTADNQLRFVPANFRFESGKRYQLILSNPSLQKHYFTAKNFADSIWSQKVDAGNVEIKGAIHDLELRPGASAQWVFVPIKAGTYDLHCSVPGHTEAGMKGDITISS